jgi:hypothetical protein
MGKLKHFALRVVGSSADTLSGLAIWVGILASLGSFFFSASLPRVPLFALALAMLVALWFVALYWKAVRESNNLTYYIGYLLLIDDMRAIQKQSFEDWLRQSDAKDARTLSNAALTAIRRLADRLAAGDPKKPATSTLLGFYSLLWNRKLGKA